VSCTGQCLKPGQREFRVHSLYSMLLEFSLLQEGTHLLTSCMTVSQEFLGTPLPESVTIVEVGPRDGLQNEKDTVFHCATLTA